MSPETSPEYRLVGPEGFDAIRPLWEELRRFHSRFAGHHPGEPPAGAFEARKRDLFARGAAGGLRVELARSGAHGPDIAYCITTLAADGLGEVESLFVEDAWRGRGIGRELLRRAMEWLDQRQARARMVTVAHANEAALALYGRFGFKPWATVLRREQPDGPFPPGPATG